MEERTNLPDWQLPPGVSRGLWDAAHDGAFASDYDASLHGTHLLNVDLDFVRRHVQRPGRFLDLGAGTGRLAIPMARAGHWVVAVDLSPPMLETLGSKARAEGVHVERVAANIVELDALSDASFDRVACLFSTLGLISGRDNRLRALRHVQRLLRPGGTFIFHVHNRWFHLWTRFGRRLLLKNAWRALWGREERGDFLMPPHQGAGPMPMHLFTRREIRRLLRDAGLRPLEIRPIRLTGDGSLCCPWFFGRLRCYGYLVAAVK